MTWYAIWEKKPEYNQVVLVANRYGRLRVVSYKGKMEGSANIYKFSRTDYPEFYYYLSCEFRWTEIDPLSKFD